MLCVVSTSVFLPVLRRSCVVWATPVATQTTSTNASSRKVFISSSPRLQLGSFETFGTFGTFVCSLQNDSNDLKDPNVPNDSNEPNAPVMPTSKSDGVY